MGLEPKQSLELDFPFHFLLLCNSLDIWMFLWAGILNKVHESLQIPMSVKLLTAEMPLETPPFIILPLLAALGTETF